MIKILKDQISYLIILAIPAVLVLPNIYQGIFAFTYDQGRDFLAVAKIVYEKDPTLIGPTTGLGGIFYGPWWYYFLTPIFLLSRGDPAKVAMLFGFLGVFTVFFLYVILKTITKNGILAFCLSAAVAMIPNWMIVPTMIWSPSLAPILILSFIYLAVKIFNKPRPIAFLLLGIVSALILDSGAAFGVVFITSLVLSVPFLIKFLKRRNILSFFLGLLVIFSPRMIFELRHNFLMTKTTISYLQEPKIYGARLNLIERFFNRMDLFGSFFKHSLTNNNKIIAEILFVFLIIILLQIIKSKPLRQQLNNDPLLRLLLLLSFWPLILFSIYPDRVWDYYLIGLPMIFILLVSKIFAYSLKIKFLNIITFFLLPLLIITNFNIHLLPPYKNDWEGNDGAYRNIKAVMDYIKLEKPVNYSFYAYSPAIFDHPFDYLFKYYTLNQKLNEPKPNARDTYLIIRESSSKKYLTGGWYGDKTKDKTTVVESHSFPGDILVERHIRND